MAGTGKSELSAFPTGGQASARSLSSNCSQRIAAPATAWPRPQLLGLNGCLFNLSWAASALTVMTRWVLCKGVGGPSLPTCRQSRWFDKQNRASLFTPRQPGGYSKPEPGRFSWGADIRSRNAAGTRQNWHPMQSGMAGNSGHPSWAFSSFDWAPPRCEREWTLGEEAPTFRPGP